MNMALLESKITESGYKKEFIAEKLGITRFGLLDKMKNPDRWKLSEVRVLVDLLALSRADAKEIFGY